MDNIKRICLWSGPRNISTALMYSFAQRSDTKVFDEPLYAHYLKNTKANEYHPGAEDILASLENDGVKVVEMMTTNAENKVVFFKNMTHHLLDLDKSFMKDVINVFLTRNPLEMLPSYAKVIKNPTIDDVGYAMHVDLLEYLNNQGIEPIIIDSKDILLNPEKALKNFCQKAGITFDKAMLSWETGARKEDGSWAKYWYDSVHKSTGFMEYTPKSEPFPDELKPLLQACLPFYERLIKETEIIRN